MFPRRSRTLWKQSLAQLRFVCSAPPHGCRYGWTIDLASSLDHGSRLELLTAGRCTRNKIASAYACRVHPYKRSPLTCLPGGYKWGPEMLRRGCRHIQGLHGGHGAGAFEEMMTYGLPHDHVCPIVYGMVN